MIQSRAARLPSALHKNINSADFHKILLRNTSGRVWWSGQNTEQPSGLRSCAALAKGEKKKKKSQFPRSWRASAPVTHLSEPRTVSVGQNVQALLPLGLLHPLSGGIRVVAAFPTAFQHPPPPYSLVPIPPGHESTSDSAISLSHTHTTSSHTHQIGVREPRSPGVLQQQVEASTSPNSQPGPERLLQFCPTPTEGHPTSATRHARTRAREQRKKNQK